MRSAALPVLLALLAGCSQISCRIDPKAEARTAWLAPPEIVETHPELDRAALAGEMLERATAAVRDAGLEIAPDEQGADLVLRIQVSEFWIGDDAVRFLRWKPQGPIGDTPTHRTVVRIASPAAPDNEARFSDFVDAGGFSREGAARRRSTALAEAVARGVGRIAGDHRRPR
ncbi:MAG: hypothetical protein HYY18_21805 [Planctomycetes bacterium]|nr:hypothetical protein [Planctomycetota bacterium]